SRYGAVRFTASVRSQKASSYSSNGRGSALLPMLALLTRAPVTLPSRSPPGRFDDLPPLTSVRRVSAGVKKTGHRGKTSGLSRGHSWSVRSRVCPRGDRRDSPGQRLPIDTRSIHRRVGPLRAGYNGLRAQVEGTEAPDVRPGLDRFWSQPHIH